MSEFEGATSILDTVEPEDELPHARGPETIGLEDTGPQKQSGGLDFEGAVGRTSTEGLRASRSPGPTAKEEDEVMEESDDVKCEEAGKERANEEGDR